MAVSIIATHIRSDRRTAGKSGWVICDFEYDDGVFDRCSGPVPADVDAVTYKNLQIPAREAGRVQLEMQTNLAAIIDDGPNATVKFDASTAVETADFIREHYQQAEREEAIAVGAYLDTLTDAQLKNAFGITQTQLDNVLRPKISRAATIWADIDAEVGS